MAESVILAGDEKTSVPHHASIGRFQQVVELRDLRPRTREAYVSYTVAIARYHRNDPAALEVPSVGFLCLPAQGAALCAQFHAAGDCGAALLVP